MNNIDDAVKSLNLEIAKNSIIINDNVLSNSINTKIKDNSNRIKKIILILENIQETTLNTYL